MTPARASIAAAILLLAAAPGSGRCGVEDPLTVTGGDGGLRRRVERLEARIDGGRSDSSSADLFLDELERLLVEEGYWSAAIRVSGDGDGGDVAGRILDPGPVWMLDSLWVETDRSGGVPEGWPEETARIIRGLSGSAPPWTEPLDDAAWGIVAFWADRGYPFVRVRPVRPSLRDGGFSLTLTVVPGPQVVVRDAVFEGDHRSRPSFLRKVLRLQGTGPWTYSESFWDGGMERLRRTGLYAHVTPPRLEIVPPERGDRPLDGRIRYDLREGATHRVEVAAGYSGESESLSGLFDLGLANLFGTGRAFDFQWERRQSARTRFLLRYREPFLWRLPFAWSVEIQHVLEDTIYTRTDLRGVVAWEIDENLWLDVGLRQERNVASAASGGGRTRTSSLFGLRWEGIGRDAAKPSGIGAEVNWSRGQTRSARPGGLRETVHEVEFKGELRASVPVLGLGRARLRAGGRFLSDPVPQFETYGIGGAATLRGYREEEFRVLRYGVAQIEAGPSLGPGGARLLFFVDGGWLLRWRKGEDALLGTKGDVSLRGAYGIGLRSLSRRGLARIDYGVAWGSDPTNGRLHVALEAPF